MLAAIDRVEHGIAIVAEVEGDRCNPHGRTDARGVLTGPPRRDASLQLGKDLAEAPADPPMGAHERPLGRRQRQVELGQAVLIDPPEIQQDIAECQGLLGVVGVKPPQSPPIGLPLPGLHAVDVSS